VSTECRRCGILTALLLQQGLQRAALSLWAKTPQPGARLARNPTKSEWWISAAVGQHHCGDQPGAITCARLPEAAGVNSKKPLSDRARAA